MREILPFPELILVYFIYGLSFFSMGLAVFIEVRGHIIDQRVRRAMMGLTVFAFVHGYHEWFEMFIQIGSVVGGYQATLGVEIGRIIALAVSFGALSFAGYLLLFKGRLKPTGRAMLLHLTIYAIGSGSILNALPFADNVALHAVDSWTRYSLGVVGGLLAGIGFLRQAAIYRANGYRRVALGSIGTGLALCLYGLLGQSVTAQSRFFPATVIHADAFRLTFGFPIQVVRTVLAMAATGGLLFMLRAMQIKRQREMDQSHVARLEAQTQAREALARQEAMRAELLRRTVSAQEAERSRIARELHDDIGQTLTALRFSADALHSDLTKRDCDLDGVERVVTLTNQALDDLAALVTDLRPAQLDHLGLSAAIYWLGDQAREHLKLDVLIDVQGKPRSLHDDIKIALFRITQEALTNIAKYAQVSEAQVQLCFESRTVILVITDDGCGFEPDPVEGPALNADHGWGIVGMRERAAALNGTFALTSTPGTGTRIEVEIPVFEG